MKCRCQAPDGPCRESAMAVIDNLCGWCRDDHYRLHIAGAIAAIWRAEFAAKTKGRA
jgi:hypothetical protein